MTGQNWILLEGQNFKTGFGAFLLIFGDFSCFLMIFEVFRGAVIVVAAGTIGRGPLGHPVSSGPVSRFSGTQKTIIRDKFSEIRKVPLMGEV